MNVLDITPWIDYEVNRYIRQELIAKCYVALAEIDHDLREWQKELNGLPDEEDDWKDIGWMSNDGVTFHI